MVAAQPPPGVSFAHLPAGWQSFGAESGAYATSWRYRPDSLGWARHMPPGGIVVQVFFPTMAKRYPPLRLVLPRRPFTVLKGTNDTLEYRIRGRARHRDVEVWVDIRRRHPTRAQLRRAQEVVRAIRFGRSG